MLFYTSDLDLRKLGGNVLTHYFFPSKFNLFIGATTILPVINMTHLIAHQLPSLESITRLIINLSFQELKNYTQTIAMLYAI